MKNIVIYSDGSSLGNPGPGGFGIVLRYKNKIKEVSGGIPHTTNNRAEMVAVIEGLKALNESCNVMVYTDSKYIVSTYNDGWQKKKNNDLWKIMDNLNKIHNIKYTWIKGHAGNPDNEKCNLLAQLAAADQAAGNGINIAMYGVKVSLQTKLNL